VRGDAVCSALVLALLDQRCVMDPGLKCTPPLCVIYEEHPRDSTEETVMMY